MFRKSRTRLEITDSFKTPSIMGLATTPLSTYKPICKRNQSSRKSSFPSNRINAATLENLARSANNNIQEKICENIKNEEENIQRDEEGMLNGYFYKQNF